MQMSSRRKFIFKCSTAAAALSLVPFSSFSLPASGQKKSSPAVPLSYAELARQVNTVFTAHLADNQFVNLTLLKVRLAPPLTVAAGCRLPADAGNEKFSLVFSASKATLLPSAIHQFEHGQLGQFAMHVGQIGRQDKPDVRYEAVFNVAATPMAANPILT